MTDIKERAAFNSILASAGLAVAKAAAAVTSGSLALLSDALHALLDVGATILTYFAVKISAKPADERHPYGHGKVEAVAALIETGLLFVVAAYVAVEAVGRLWKGSHELPVSWLAYGVLAVSIVVDIVRARSLERIARETGSQALEADALHFSSDLVSSSLVLAGLVAAGYGYHQGDLLAAIGVAAFIAFAGYRLGKRTIDTLMDAVPKGLTPRIRDLVADVPGVAKVDGLRVRSVGNEIFAEVAIGIARTLPLDRAAAIKSDVTAAVQAEYPQASVVVSTSPMALDAETIMERVLHVAALQRRPVHHITVQRIEGRNEPTLSISLDLEVDSNLSLAEGHAIASVLESSIAAELGGAVEVDVHLEPLEVEALEGSAISENEAVRIRETLRKAAQSNPVIRDVHDIRLRRTAAGIVCNYHCYVDGQRYILEVHDHVDALDREVRRLEPEITRIVGHAEPKPS